MRKLARLTGVSPGTLHRELTALASLGVLPLNEVVDTGPKTLELLQRPARCRPVLPVDQIDRTRRTLAASWNSFWALPKISRACLFRCEIAGVRRASTCCALSISDRTRILAG